MCRRDYISKKNRFWEILVPGSSLCIHVAPEGEDLITLSAGISMAYALGLPLSVYHVFDIAYQAKASNVYFFCKMLIGIEQDAKKRIAIQPSEVAQNCF